ncbi:hypothetical protein E0Z10_g9750 [Xylaria hypoxylon]|uniref:Suppressor of anucleate metulae protein B n=1 Tax=Xylaria hypoxylon TaxID=37992 RepID=A0A4Z0Y7T2_9PEZI|nr:hypothetical protein E0Z10_g9750 [Xylaria hypoxylon]
MLDPWDELETLQKGRRDSLVCARDLANIRDSCVREHGKSHVVECPECWTRLINRLRDRYLNSAIKEWFSGRRAFLQELDDLFAKARRHEVDFKTIEDRIANERKEWFRDRVCNLGLHLAARSPAEAQAIQQKTNDRDIPISQLVLELRECLGVDAKLHREVSTTFLNKVKTTQSPTARAHAYIEALFQPERDLASAAKSRKYIDMITDGKPVAEMISTMVRDRQSPRDLDQKQTLQKKLKEIERAKAAHELNKNKRDQMRQEKARAAMSSNAADTMPACSVCTKTVDAQKFLACPLCQVLADNYKLLDGPTLFCSETCHEKGYDSHVETSHECSSGLDCFILTDPDSEMEVDEPLVVFCQECVEEFGQQSVFCSSRCLEANFQRHWERVHIPERERIRHDELDEEGQIESDGEDEMRYSDGKAEPRIISLRDAVINWQQKTEASIAS